MVALETILNLSAFLLLTGANGGGHWDFRFCRFGYLLDRFFGFCDKDLQIFRFLASGFRF